MSSAKPGDSVRITTDEEEYSGILMPRPEILERGIIVVKLENGYNIGIEEKKIKKIELAERYSPKEKAKPKISADKSLPNVTILSTGGTISSRVDYRTGGVHADYTAEDFCQMMPEIAKAANIRARKIMSAMSEDMASKEWQQIAKEVASELQDSDGVVVTMGTDTLHFAAAALSFFLGRTGKPVVITAAQRSIDRGSSDAFMNLSCAVSAAKSDIAEVMSCMHATPNDDYCFLIRGTKVRKMHTSRRDAFRPVNELPIAKVFPDGKIETLNGMHRKRESCRAAADCKFEEKTALIYAYPGMDGEVIDFYAGKGYKGIVIAGTALGHVPSNGENSILPNIKKAIEKNAAVVIATQSVYGRVHPLVYTNLRKLSVELGCIFAEDMLPETAYVKLGWVLGHTTKKEEVRKMMLESCAGEITDRTSFDSFLY